MPSDTELLEHLYDRFNARDMSGPGDHAPGRRVGQRLGGRACLRTRWCPRLLDATMAMIDSHAEPVGFSIGADGTMDVEVHLTARDLKGNLLFDKMGGHIFRIDGLIRRFDIR